MKRDLVIASKLENIEKVRGFLLQIYSEFCLNVNSFNRVFLGISEAVNNAIVHGNKLDTAKKVFIRTNLFGNQFQIEIEDEGQGFSEAFLVDPTLPENVKQEHGRGIYLVRQLAGELFFEDEGRKVIIQFTIPE